ncbi:GDB1 Glycogen debranching enzyme [Candida maltosa Xu316]|uniref:Glycogen debranching enzyme n=1 Tax=Candida maltosa (strain Xu316) TaxID=1245528 RepID=M3JST8_CANMX|nr:Glycogen debranching enzyme [Candida maltosa Xu316]
MPAREEEEQRTILFRLSNLGQPVNNENINNGVLILPALELPKNYQPGDLLFNLQFQLNAASKVSNNGVFYTNVPPSFDKQFDRNTHYETPIKSSFHKDIIFTVPIYKPGAYNYYIKYNDENDDQQTTEKFYFNVPPNLTINGKFVPFNNINVETVVSKWIGPYEENWDAFFKDVAEKGYNMIHFTPLQERGESDSPYSIYDQLKFDPKIFPKNELATKQIHKVLNDNNLLSLTDVVWNHTANNSEWLRESPNSGYNATTAPHLIPAIELDEELLTFSKKLKDFDLPTTIENEADLQKILESINTNVLDKLKLWEYYVFNKRIILENLETSFTKNKNEINWIHIPDDVDVNDLKQLAKYVLETANVHEKPIVGGERFSNNLNVDKFLGILFSVFDANVSFDTLADKAEEIVDEINADLYALYDEDIKSIKQQVADRIRYLRLADNGPKLGEINDKSPLTEPYFTRFVDKSGKKQALANNGWIWGGNPLVDFASDKSRAYIRREIIVWGDCVKLRYGDKYEDSPETWDRMIEYTKLSAKVFNGFRIDNCHSTPLHVGERLLDEARKVNPNLYVIAELFSGSEEMDKIFVERFGINSLIREAMQAWNVGELSRLVHKHGGRPIGSLTWLPLDDFSYPAKHEPTKNKFIDGYTELEIPKVLTSQAPHAIFMDCTHDNEMPAQKRTVEDTLPNAALVAFCSSAIGSVYGYDECYPALLNVVSEHRLYDFKKQDEYGIGKVKAKLHKIRDDLVKESEDILRDHEMYIHHEGQYITIQRYNARTGKGKFLIARSKFSSHEGPQILSPSVLGGTKVKHEFSYTLKKTGDYVHNDKYLTGIPVKVEDIPAPSIEYTNGDSIIRVDDSFIPGSIAVFSTEIPGNDINLDNFVKEGAIEASLGLDLYDLNAILYRASTEELDASDGKEDVYDIPNYGRLVYAGLEGWNTALKHVVWSNNLGHAICNHLRDGEWAFDYVVNRLDKYAANSKNLKKFQDWLRSRFDAVRKVPYFLRPHYFALIVGIAYEASRFRALRLFNEKIQESTNFVQSLALTSVQMVGYMKNTSLVPDRQVACLAAGLPHFSSNYMRCWGRDVFISFRGLLIVPGRYGDAKEHILGFAKTLKHGLIPNLLDAGRNPRYNARDAVWFFLQAIQEYVQYAPNGIDILDEKVTRRFPLDDTYIPVDDPQAFSYKSSIKEIIYEIFERHAKGIKYREANAGPNLDSQMKDEGFNVEVGVDWESGLVYGGNQFNCGTWMDKMGESEKAHNKGIPGTPRDGSAIELQGLLKSALRFINKLQDEGKFPYKEVTKSDNTKITFKQWEKLLQDNFEKYYYIPEDPSQDSQYKVDPNIVNRRGVYKDLYGSGKPFEDYQLRPNFAIAMIVAPELFTPELALGAITKADEIIRGPVGMRTLDPSDWNYRPYYENSIDNDDFATSKGRNYHQGPEWVWNTGYFLRSFLLFHCLDQKGNKNNNNKPNIKILTLLNERLQGHLKWIKESPWSGLTELTNKDGEICNDSSPTQAWSGSCLLDLYFDLWNDEHYQ